MSPPAITPVILTWNEAPNIERVLSRLEWAQRILVLDSGSDDGTQDLARSRPNVVVYEHPFESHASQAELAIRHPAVGTDWVLALDADFVLSPDLVRELEVCPLDAAERGYRIPVRYCIDGRPLRASLYPDVLALFDRRRARFEQIGHAHKAVVDGPVGRLRGEILHDDRKPFERFLASQRRYAVLEARRLRSEPWSRLPWTARIRRARVVAPWLVPLYVLLAKGVLLDGAAGWRYARERFLAELTIARELFRSER